MTEDFFIQMKSTPKWETKPTTTHHHLFMDSQIVTRRSEKKTHQEDTNLRREQTQGANVTGLVFAETVNHKTKTYPL